MQKQPVNIISVKSKLHAIYCSIIVAEVTIMHPQFDLFYKEPFNDFVPCQQKKLLNITIKAENFTSQFRNKLFLHFEPASIEVNI